MADLQSNQDIVTVAEGGGVTFAGGILTRGINFIYTAVLVRALGAEGFGLFTLALAIITFVQALAALGLELGVVRFGAIQAQQGGRVAVHRITVLALRISLLAAVLAVGILLATANSIAAGVFHKPELAPLIMGLSLCLPLMSVQALLLAATRALKLVSYSATVWVAQPLAALALAVLILALGGGRQAAAFSLVASYVISAGLAAYFYARVVPRKGQGAQAIPLWAMLKFAVPLSLSQWIHMANQRTEIFFLGLLPRAVDVGIYNVAWRLAGLETIFTESVSAILGPLSSDLSHRRLTGRLQELYQTTTKWAFAFAFALFGIFTLIPQSILGVFDPSFAVGAWVLIALGFAQLINAATGPCGTILIMSGRSDLNLVNTIVLLIVSIALDWLLIPSYGLAGAALAGALAVILVNLLRVTEVWLTLKIHPFKRSMMAPLLAGIFAWAIVRLIQTTVSPQSILLDFVYAVLFIALYMATIYLFKLDDQDILVLRTIRLKVDSLVQHVR